MISKPDTNIINNALEQICAHPLFVNSSVYTRLLRYLVEKALSNEDIKEYTIGNDLFGKNYLDDKNDGTVRTYMYKLRKKLAEYYEDKNRSHDVIFEIEKGQYNLNFLSGKAYYQNHQTPHIKVPIKAIKRISAILVFLFVIAWFAYSYLNPTPAIWKSYFVKNAENLLIISDQYMLMAQDEDGRKYATMHMEINSDEDLFEYEMENPTKKFTNTDFTLMSKMAPYTVKILDNWFLAKGRNYKLQLESELSVEDIKENNIIFVGQYKTMNLSESLFLKNSQCFSTYKDGFKYSKDGKETVYNTSFKFTQKVEYAMVSYTSFHPDKKALYFVSNNDVGVMATLKNFTDKEFLKSFMKQLPSKDSQFNALFKVEGIERTDVSCELVELEVIE